MWGIQNNWSLGKAQLVTPSGRVGPLVITLFSEEEQFEQEWSNKWTFPDDDEADVCEDDCHRDPAAEQASEKPPSPERVAEVIQRTVHGSGGRGFSSRGTKRSAAASSEVPLEPPQKPRRSKLNSTAVTLALARIAEGLRQA